MTASATDDRDQRQQEQQRPVPADREPDDAAGDARRPAPRPQGRAPGGRPPRRTASSGSSSSAGLGLGHARRSAHGTSRPPSPQSSGARRSAASTEPRHPRARRACSAASPASRSSATGTGAAGEQLELEHRLVHQQVEPADQHPAAGGRRQRRRPRVVEHLEDDRHVGAAGDQLGVLGRRPGPSRRRPRRSTGSPASEPTRTCGADGCAAIAADGLGGALGRADQDRDRLARRARRGPGRWRPRSRRRRAPCRAVTGPSYRSRTAATAPGQVGVVGEHGPPVLEQQRVGRAGEARPGRSRSAATAERLALERHRQRQAAPVRVRARRGSRRARRPATRWASYSQSSPSAAYPARCSTGDSEWAIGSPRTPQRRSTDVMARSAGAFGLGLAVVAQLVLVAEELVVGLGELGLAGRQVDGDVVVPVAVGRVGRRLRSPRRRAPRSGAGGRPGYL